MKIGVPKEIKPHEGRVALIPEACAQLRDHGHEVLIQKGAGLASGYPDDAYGDAGATMVGDASQLYSQAELVVKVKEPVAREWPLLRPNQLLFCFLHLAASPDLSRALCDSGVTAIAFETVAVDGHLPLLAPMSEIAGTLSVQIGAHLLHAAQGGRGLLLGGTAGVSRGDVVVVGCGSAGMAAAQLAAAMGSRVTAFDLNPSKLQAARALGPNVTSLYPYPKTIAEALRQADLAVGAVLVPGARAPNVLTRAMIRGMPKGAVLVDISVDQGGCAETTKPRSYDDPTYVDEGVVHFTVTNMPGAVPRSATQALSAAIMPYVHRLASGDWRHDPALQAGLNVESGRDLLADRVRDAREGLQ